MVFTITDFWEPRLSVPAREGNEALEGWNYIRERLPTFLEAPLRLLEDFGNTDPKNSSVILVSAPGAVGKSTLARQISFKTKSILVDLAEAEPVGANTLVGGLARTNLYQPFLQGNASLVVDGLDEARMQVTEGGFEAFIRDIVDLVEPDRKPVILFGRTGAVQETWLWLSEISENKIEAPVLEIGYYDQLQAAEFCKIQAQHLRQEPTKREPDGRAIDLFLNRLQNDFQLDQASFSGYAPVLIALAKRVAGPDGRNNENMQALISRIEKGKENITLTSICDFILSREKQKLQSLNLQDQTLREMLYTPDEQIGRLIAQLYGGAPPYPSLDMSPQDQEKYNNALETWVPEHPFLDGTGKCPSSAVFGGLLASKALHSGIESVVEGALRKEFDRGTSASPFLGEFYISELGGSNPSPAIRDNHVGVLHASLCSRVSQGESVSLRIDGESDADEMAEVEIIRKKRNNTVAPPLYFSTNREGNFRFGSSLEDIEIIAPHAQITVGCGAREVVFVAPVSIQCEKISFETDEVVVKSSPRGSHFKFDPIVSLKANVVDAMRILHPPRIRGKVTLEVFGRGFEAYLWTSFASDIPDNLNHAIDEPLRRLKRILQLFRAHGGDQLAKFSDAIEHRRRTRGSGQIILDQLVAENVLRKDGWMYYLDSGRLSEVVGLSYQDLQSAHTTLTTTQTTINFLKRALDQAC